MYTTQITEEIDSFAKYLPTIEHEETAVFEKNFLEHLELLNDLSQLDLDQRQELRKYFIEACAEELDKGVMQNQSRNKPFGYPGDHLVIDWIYTRKTAISGNGKLWDELYHRQAAPQAVRNRKDFFCKTLEALCLKKQGRVSVLDIASGPCRDIAEAVSMPGVRPERLSFHCVDVDPKAIEYAKGVIYESSQKAIFLWEAANAFRIKPQSKYDLVWSAGLFDYLNSRYAVFLLKRMWGWTKEGGSLIFGNFHPRNPSRNYMEWCGGWFLIHRTEEDMSLLCKMAGIPEACISFEQEPLGVNIFCVARKY